MTCTFPEYSRDIVDLGYSRNTDYIILFAYTTPQTKSLYARCHASYAIYAHIARIPHTAGHSTGLRRLRACHAILKVEWPFDIIAILMLLYVSWSSRASGSY